MSVSSVTYTYPCPSLGSEVLSTNIGKIEDPTVADIRSRYEQLFLSEEESAKSYKKIQNNLFNALDEILPNFSSKKDSSELVNFNEIAETYRLLNAEAECKEGAKAYKYYLKEIVSNLNQLTQAINGAREAILKLNTADITSDQAHELITKLEIYDKQAQEATEAFASYSICKTITTQRYTFASNYTDNCKFTGSSTYEQVETAYKDLTQPIVSAIGDSVTNLEDLRKLKVANNKCNVTRAVYTIYYTDEGEGKNKIIYGDKYDSNSKVMVQSEDKDIVYEAPASLSLFDELTLLDKVKYIRLYYKHSAEDISKTEEYISNLWKSISNTEKDISNIESGLGELEKNVSDIKYFFKPKDGYYYQRHASDIKFCFNYYLDIYRQTNDISESDEIVIGNGGDYIKKNYIQKTKESIENIKKNVEAAEADRLNLAGYNNIQSVSEIEKGIQNIDEYQKNIGDSITSIDGILAEIETDLDGINDIISNIRRKKITILGSLDYYHYCYVLSGSEVKTINEKISDIEQKITNIEANITNIKTNITNIKEKDEDASNTEKISVITTDAANNSTVYIHERYVFPEDTKSGFPCIHRETNAGGPSNDPNYYVDDVNEICCLELFYVGYLVNRDGAANALASFMEIKTSAILQQIKLLSYRVKALQYYLKLLNRGFQYLNQANNNGGSIPEEARYVLQFVGSNTLYTLYRNDQGQDRILVVKNGGTNGTAKYDCTDFYEISTTDEGVENFAARRGYSTVHLDPPPKALDTQLTGIANIIKMAGVYYNACGEHRSDFFNAWTKTYDTVIKNLESSLECVNKNIESLRTKVNTFDGSAASFRTKAYSIFNKLVNHIQ